LRKEKGGQLSVFARRDEVDWHVRHGLPLVRGDSGETSTLCGSSRPQV